MPWYFSWCVRAIALVLALICCSVISVLVTAENPIQIYATIIGSNIGAFLTPVGALAGIMWLNLLKKNQVELSTRKFVFYGTFIGAPSIAAALGVLEFIF